MLLGGCGESTRFLVSLFESARGLWESGRRSSWEGCSRFFRMAGVLRPSFLFEVEPRSRVERRVPRWMGGRVLAAEEERGMLKVAADCL